MPAFTRRNVLRAGLVVPLAAVLDACGGTAPGGDAGPAVTVGGTAGAAGAPVTAVVITSIASIFDITTVHVPVGRPVVFTYRNQHDGVPHNLHVSGPDVDELTPVRPGQVVQTLTVTFPQTGSYDYVCDVHPESMVGVVEVG